MANKLIPDYIKTSISVPNQETGLLEVKDTYKINYYRGSYPLACKSCLVKKNDDLTYTMNLRRNGSAYCAPCAENYRLSSQNVV